MNAALFATSSPVRNNDQTSQAVLCSIVSGCTKNILSYTCGFGKWIGNRKPHPGQRKKILPHGLVTIGDLCSKHRTFILRLYRRIGVGPLPQPDLFFIMT